MKDGDDLRSLHHDLHQGRIHLTHWQRERLKVQPAKKENKIKDLFCRQFVITPFKPSSIFSIG